MNGDEVITVVREGDNILATMRDADEMEYALVIFPEEGEGEEKCGG